MFLGKQEYAYQGRKGFQERVVDSAKPLRGQRRMRTAKTLVSFSWEARMAFGGGREGSGA